MTPVWIHGSLSSAQLWRPFVRRFGGRAVDLPGALGRAPVHTGDAWSVDDDLAAITAVAGSDPVCLVGHSYGGLLALRWAVDHPERTARVIAHEPVVWPLVLGRPPDLARLGVEGVDGLLDPARGGSEPWLRSFVDFWNGPGGWERLPDVLRRAAVAAGHKTWLEVHHACHEPTTDDAWRALRVPVRITVGEESPAPEQAVVRRLEGLLPDVELRATAGGHNAPLTHPAALSATWAPWLVAD
jgi:pimeloyl-ACP methyl ester carboxylesterase